MNSLSHLALFGFHLSQGPPYTYSGLSILIGNMAALKDSAKTSDSMVQVVNEAVNYAPHFSVVSMGFGMLFTLGGLYFTAEAVFEARNIWHHFKKEPDDSAAISHIPVLRNVVRRLGYKV